MGCCLPCLEACFVKPFDIQMFYEDESKLVGIIRRILLSYVPIVSFLISMAIAFSEETLSYKMSLVIRGIVSLLGCGILVLLLDLIVFIGIQISKCCCKPTRKQA